MKIKAFGLNRMDLGQREGKYPVPPHASKILGVEFSGIIEQINVSGSCRYKVGDEVFGLAYGGTFFPEGHPTVDSRSMTGSGAYAEYIAVSNKMLLHKPKELSWEQAAGIPEVLSWEYIHYRARLT